MISLSRVASHGATWEVLEWAAHADAVIIKSDISALRKEFLRKAIRRFVRVGKISTTAKQDIERLVAELLNKMGVKA